MNKFSCCYENKSNGLYSELIFRRFILFFKTFVKKKFYNDFPDDIEKIFKKKIFGILKQIIRTFIDDELKSFMVIFFQIIYEEEKNFYLIYKFISVIYCIKFKGINLLITK